jgi:hypothetical protein
MVAPPVALEPEMSVLLPLGWIEDEADDSG